MLTGINLLKSSGQHNLLEEADRIISEHIEEQKTINDRILKVRKKAARNGMAFTCVQKNKKWSKYLGAPAKTSLMDNINSVDRKFVVVDGILSRLENIKSVLGANIAKSLEGSGTKWILADYPYFAMGRSGFESGAVILEIDDKVATRIEEELPFWRPIG